MCFHLLGYTPAIKGQLLHVDATTSMQYRTLLEAEMLAVSLEYMMILFTYIKSEFGFNFLI